MKNSIKKPTTTNNKAHYKFNNHIVIFGGSFDPPHLGHLQTAQLIQQKFHSDQFIFLPCKNSVLKTIQPAPAEHRLNMLNLAIQTLPHNHKYSIDAREINRSSPSYMIETLKSFRQEWGNQISLILLIGWDAFLTLPQWHQCENLLNYCHIVVMHRETHPNGPLNQLPYYQHLTQDISKILNTPSGYIHIVNAGHYSISSTWIRDQIKQHQSVQKSVQNHLPNCVYEYIIKNRLYLAK